jgi:hypothetical protein
VVSHFSVPPLQRDDCSKFIHKYKAKLNIGRVPWRYEGTAAGAENILPVHPAGEPPVHHMYSYIFFSCRFCTSAAGQDGRLCCAEGRNLAKFQCVYIRESRAILRLSCTTRAPCRSSSSLFSRGHFENPFHHAGGSVKFRICCCRLVHAFDLCVYLAHISGDAVSLN